MTWSSVHRRGETLRTVTETADLRRDGVLPMDVAGVAETFRDELDLLGALQLRWHTRLSGRIERELVSQPLDLEQAVIAAWHGTADEMPGIRLVLDQHRRHPLDDAMATAMAKAAVKERSMLAVMAGRANATDELSAARVGEGIENLARHTWLVPAVVVDVEAERPVFSERVLTRLKAALAA